MMLQTRHEIIDQFRTPELAPHARYPGFRGFAFLASWPPSPISVALPHLTVEIHAVDYLRREAYGAGASRSLRLQAERYLLWYQIDGDGVLQDLSRNAFGKASPGLLGVIDSGRRYGYLHQRGTFECFLLDFALRPAARSHCYWNSQTEGRLVLPETERPHFDRAIFTLLRMVCNGDDPWGIACAARLCDLVTPLFARGLLIVNDEHFPRNKGRSLARKAREYMDAHYAGLHHQRDLAAACGVDVNYLNILFRRETGVTLYDHLSAVRMEHAKHLLETGDESVVEVAGRVGYPNASSFSRAFRRRAGMSPTAYVRMHRPHSAAPTAPAAASDGAA